MDTLKSVDLINELLKRAEDFEDQQCKDSAIEELENVQKDIADMVEDGNFKRILPNDVYDIINRHITKLKAGGSDA